MLREKERVKKQRSQSEIDEETRRAAEVRARLKYGNCVFRYVSKHYGYIIDTERVKAPKWTVTSANCYYRNMNCEGCENYEFCKTARFNIRWVVRRLVQERGVDNIKTDIKENDYKFLDKKKFHIYNRVTS